MIKLGITGHRNLKEKCISFYRNKIHSQLKFLEEQYDEILLYSSLSEGADRLVVEVALALDISFVAVLPMKKEYYLIDFTEQSKIDFNILLDCACSVIEMPLVKGYTQEDVMQDQYKRSFQYEASGYFISDHCNALMTLWDGKNTYLRGGTGEIVKHYLDKEKHKLYHLQVSRNTDLTNDMIEFRIFE